MKGFIAALPDFKQLLLAFFNELKAKKTISSVEDIRSVEPAMKEEESVRLKDFCNRWALSREWKKEWVSYIDNESGESSSEDDVAGPGRELRKTGMKMMARKRELIPWISRVS